MKFLLIPILLFSLFSLPELQENTCDCSAVFEEVVKNVEDNYLALKLENPEISKSSYRKRIKQYRSKVNRVSSENCTEWIQKFLSFFADKHLFVFEQPEYSNAQLNMFEQQLKNSRMPIGQIKEAVNNYQGQESLVGFYWDGNSVIAIRLEEKELVARIIKSTHENISPGEIKAVFRTEGNKQYSATYYSYKYEPRYIEGGLYKQDLLLSMNGGIRWKKLKPDEIDADLSTFTDPSLPTISDLGNGTTLFTIPSFSTDYQKFIGVLTKNLPLLTETDRLIFDIRGNTGGNAIYFAFIDAYAKQNLRSSQGKVLASESTLAYFERLAKNSPGIYQPVVNRIKENMGQVIDGPAYPEREYKSSEDFHINDVAILTDQGCMSASESFIIHSKAVNPEVQTFGQPTSGVIDYTSVNAIPVESGNRNIYFGYPTSSLHMEIPKNGFNKTGIVPDVAIPTSESDPIGFIINKWNKD